MQQKLIFLACFFISAKIFSQQYPFVSYTPKDGLVNSRVRGIKQDSKGRLLFTTYGGLSIYDGTQFFNYNQQDGLANELVNDIVEISSDSFLVATNIHTLNTLVHGKIGVYKTADDFCPIINRFLKSKDGNWYVDADDGLFEFKNKKFIHLPLQQDGEDLGTCLDKIIEWGNFFLIIPWNTELRQKLILYDRSICKVKDVVTNKKILSAVVDVNNNVWVNTIDGTEKLDTFSLAKGKVRFRPSPPVYNAVKNSILFFDAYNNAWFFNTNEIQRITPDLQRQIISTEQGLKAGTLSNLFQDREGIMWIATDGNGVIKLKTTGIQLLTTIEGKRLTATAIAHVKDTTWLFNNANNCIYRTTDAETKKFLLPQKIAVSKIYAYRQKLYLVSSEEILSVANKNDKRSYFYPSVFFKDHSLNIGSSIMDSYGSVISMIKKNDTSFYLCVINQNKIVTQYKVDYLIDQMAFDNSGNLWVVTRKDHIMMFKLNPSEPSHYLKLIEDFQHNLPQMGSRCITIGTDNAVWIGTRNNGLYHFKFINHQLYLSDHFTTKNGLIDNFIYTLARDQNNTIWIGTETGLDKIYKKGKNYIVANVGKNNNIFQIINKIEITSDGTVWSLNNDGTILKISSGIVPSNTSPPSFLLTSIKINNREQSGNNFSYRENNLSFTVAAPSYFDEGSIKYSCFLEGSDNNNWSAPSNLAIFSFINLNPGSYVLHARCDFPEAMYPSQEVSYFFIIRKPWWQTWWFISVVTIFSALLLFLIVRGYYTGKLQKQKMILEKKQAVEKERTRIATDMHDDLGAGLSRIKFLSETIGIKKQQLQPIEEDVIKIREYSHQMIDKMGEIVWALNEKNDSLNDLIFYTRAYAMEYLSQNGIDCKMQIASFPENIFVSGEFRRNIFLSIKEILHNIVKHAQANLVFITVEVKKDLAITIKDNGIGFNQSEIRPFSNGLYNIVKRMTDINGKSEIINTQGTIISLKAPFS